MSRIWALAALLWGLSQGLLAAEDNPLVDLQTYEPAIRVEQRYKTADNFVGVPLYPADARCLVRAELAERLRRVQRRLEERGLGLKVYDGYRPLSVQKQMWAKVPIEGFVANPAKGSNHNRGAAVDLTLVDSDGRELEMPSAYDEFTERAHRSYAGGSASARANRALLQAQMELEGFKGLATEWWHFDLPEAKQYPVLDLPFSELAAAGEAR